jgi:hypothetical protein
MMCSSAYRSLTLGVIGLVTLTMSTIGCSSTAKIAQSSKGAVYLEEVADWSYEASHPAVIDQATILKVIKGLYSDDSQDGSSRMSAGGGKPMRIFSDEDAEFLTPLLAQGLSKAKPEQLVGFRVSPSAGSGSEPTTGSMYVRNDALYVTISKGAHVAGFTPESAAHSEQAPSYAASGFKSATSTVIDYHALAKASMPAAIPVAKTTPKVPTAPIAAAAPAATMAKPQMTANSSVSSIQNEFQSPEISQIDQAKETIAKKNTEINMLRKESEWMKRELRERDEEIKALKASKVSIKPAPKKKKAEAYPTR